MVSKWVFPPIYFIYMLVISHLLTIDPNFQRDIQVVPISTTSRRVSHNRRRLVSVTGDNPLQASRSSKQRGWCKWAIVIS